MVQVVAGWNTVLVKQDDGVVVIEAPISAGYTARLLAEEARPVTEVAFEGAKKFRWVTRLARA